MTTRFGEAYDAQLVQAMRADQQFMDAVKTFMSKTFEYGYYRNFLWLGRPVIQYPQDVLALQELIWSYRPTLVIETGVAHGGALLLYASIMQLAGIEGRVAGVELEFREHNRVELERHPLGKTVTVIEGSSTDARVFAQVQSVAHGHERAMVILDSNHTHEHVLDELRLYSTLARRGAPLVVFGTSVAYLDPAIDLQRPWNQQRNPHSALQEFLAENDRFVVDRELSDKLLITDAPGGYLQCVKDP